MIRKFIMAAGGLAVLACSTSAIAWGDTYRKSGQILSRTFPIKLNNGRIGTASIVYAVAAGIAIQEGMGNFGRNCQFVPVDRTFTRSVTIKGPGGKTLTPVDAIYKLPVPARREYNDPCGDHATGEPSDFWRFMDETIGNSTSCGNRYWTIAPASRMRFRWSAAFSFNSGIFCHER